MQDIQIGGYTAILRETTTLWRASRSHRRPGEPYVIYRKLYGDGGLWTAACHVSQPGRPGKVPRRAAG